MASRFGRNKKRKLLAQLAAMAQSANDFRLQADFHKNRADIAYDKLNRLERHIAFHLSPAHPLISVKTLDQDLGPIMRAFPQADRTYNSDRESILQALILHKIELASRTDERNSLLFTLTDHGACTKAAYYITSDWLQLHSSQAAIVDSISEQIACELVHHLKVKS